MSLASKSGVKSRGGGTPRPRPGSDRADRVGSVRASGVSECGPGLRRFRILGMVEILCPIPSIPRPSNTDK